MNTESYLRSLLVAEEARAEARLKAETTYATSLRQILEKFLSQDREGGQS